MLCIHYHSFSAKRSHAVFYQPRDNSRFDSETATFTITTSIFERDYTELLYVSILRYLSLDLQLVTPRRTINNTFYARHFGEPKVLQLPNLSKTVLSEFSRMYGCRPPYFASWSKTRKISLYIDIGITRWCSHAGVVIKSSNYFSFYSSSFYIPLTAAQTIYFCSKIRREKISVLNMML